MPLTIQKATPQKGGYPKPRANQAVGQTGVITRPDLTDLHTLFHLQPVEPGGMSPPLDTSSVPPRRHSLDRAKSCSWH